MAQQKAPMASGASYFMLGFSLITTPGIRRFVFIPLFVNLLLFAAAFYYLYLQIEPLLQAVQDWLPEMLQWLNYIFYPLAIATILAVFSFIFSTIANWIAAPFNGMLSERMEQILTGQVKSDGGVGALMKDVPRTLKREWRKLIYYIPKAIGFFILFWILPVIGQLIWFVFTAWSMAIQYCDYPFDNQKVAFDDMRKELKQNQGKAYSFGITTTIFTMLPIVNMIVMPVAICGATAMWVDHFRDRYQ